MPGSMIEQVARALCSHDGLPENTKHDGKPMWMDFMPEARTALAAMRIRDPLSPILAAGQCTTELWNRMIDAALEEE
jgi:selenocysteine lyase/cysteine desulfurase